MTHQPIEPAIIIKKMVERYGDKLSERVRIALNSLPELKPGIEGESMKAALGKIDVLREGGIVILQGRIGCGKTVAAYATLLMYQWPVYLDRANDYDNLDHYQKKYAQEFLQPSPQFKIIPARKILKNALDDPDIYALDKSLIMIDDLGTEYFTDKGWGISEWDYFFDCRYTNKLHTLITTNLTPDEFVIKYDQRILNRLKECAEWIPIKSGSLRKAHDV